ncbi:hypothetical protein GCM10027440_50190 [Nocardiopsis coralliicola]
MHVPSLEPAGRRARRAVLERMHRPRNGTPAPVLAGEASEARGALRWAPTVMQPGSIRHRTESLPEGDPGPVRGRPRTDQDGVRSRGELRAGRYGGRYGGGSRPAGQARAGREPASLQGPRPPRSAGVRPAAGRRYRVEEGAGGGRRVEAAPCQVLDARGAVRHRDAAQYRACRSHPYGGWVYLSPPAVLEPGARTGRYRRGTTTLLVDEAGGSRIAAGDLAIAVLDELEKPSGEQHLTVAG